MAKFHRKLKLRNYRKLPTYQLQSTGMYFDFELDETSDDRIEPGIFGKYGANTSGPAMTSICLLLVYVIGPSSAYRAAITDSWLIGCSVLPVCSSFRCVGGIFLRVSAFHFPILSQYLPQELMFFFHWWVAWDGYATICIYANPYDGVYGRLGDCGRFVNKDERYWVGWMGQFVMPYYPNNRQSV